MSKAKYIQANYIKDIQFDVEGIDWDKVEDYSIRYLTLSIYYKDGTEETFSAFEEFEIDWKWPNSEKVLDENWNEIEVSDE